MNLKGNFVLKRVTRDHDVFVFEFEEPDAASKATWSQFIVTLANKSTDKILPSVEIIIKFSFQIMMAERVAEYCEKLLSGIEDMKNDKSDDKVDEAKSTVIALKEETNKAILPCVEITRNQIICDMIVPRATEMGYIVKTNTSAAVEGESPWPVSKFFNSRPDLVIYHPQKLQACLVVSDEESDTESLEDEKVTLRSGITENKNVTKRSGKAQLLAGMDKVAGDIASEYTRRYEKLFDEIVVYGLIMKLDDEKCSVHKLIMDFNTHVSTFESGKEEILIVDGVNRLLKVLE